MVPATAMDLRGVFRVPPSRKAIEWQAVLLAASLGSRRAAYRHAHVGNAAWGFFVRQSCSRRRSNEREFTRRTGRSGSRRFPAVASATIGQAVRLRMPSMNGDKLAVGHPTPGSGNDAAAGPATATQLHNPAWMQGCSGLPDQAGACSGRHPPRLPDRSVREHAGGADGQSGESPSSMPGSSSQPQAGEAGGSPSIGAPPDGASDGEPGPSGASSDASTSNEPSADSGSAFMPNADEDDAPRRKGQQSARHWGISSPRASIGFEHDLTLYIEAGRVYVGNQPPIPCGRRENSDQLAFAVLRAVNREARTWGRPRENFYWVPNLKIVVCAGGILQYERLQPAFERQGLSSTVEYRLEQSRPAPLPRLVTD